MSDSEVMRSGQMRQDILDVERQIAQDEHGAAVATWGLQEELGYCAAGSCEKFQDWQNPLWDDKSPRQIHEASDEVVAACRAAHGCFFEQTVKISGVDDTADSKPGLMSVYPTIEEQMDGDYYTGGLNAQKED